ncbi:hypothetical protein M9H77_27146 [Catharanthus roseus]|uniref:Uncharacterized protein n=1 Tax=Catharanthus roseus TaxID=4058 RepID=A0ACC0AEE1_CATRO|nr:hypothetical protein M9H77_27146 [Catharanthus roseus]
MRIHPQYKIVDLHKDQRYGGYDHFLLAHQVEQVSFLPYLGSKRTRTDWLSVIKSQPGELQNDKTEVEWNSDEDSNDDADDDPDEDSEEDANDNPHDDSIDENITMARGRKKQLVEDASLSTYTQSTRIPAPMMIHFNRHLLAR